MNILKAHACALAIVAAPFLSGCAALMHIALDDQLITISANDDDEYDFYVDGNLVCGATDECDFYRSQDKPCQMIIEARRGDLVYGQAYYGYWDEQPRIIGMMGEQDVNKCPETVRGADVIVEIDPAIKAREEALRRKVRDAQWQKSPLSSSSGE